MNTALKERTVSLAILFAAVLISALIMGSARAQTETENAAPEESKPSTGAAPTGGQAITFPVPELGNCASKSDCKTYCDQPDNMGACITFAEKNGLMPKEEVEMAKKFMAAGGKGPGGCTGKDSCEQFCNDISNIDTCVDFAEKSGMMPPKELDEAKKVQAAIKRGVKPPPCGGKRACDAYCEDPNHIEECVAFASAAGFMSKEEQANAQKMVQAIKSGVKPLPCRGKDECDAYCGQEQNLEQCVAFAEAAGFMSKDDASMARKTRGKGPGGCKGKEECEAFCNNPDNQETCFNFGKDNGLIPPEELQKMEEGDKQFRGALQNAPPEVATCLKESLGPDVFEKLKDGAARPTRELGEKMGACFKQMEEQRAQNEDGNRDGGERGQRGSFERGMPNGQRPDDRGFGGESGFRGEGQFDGPRDGQRFDPRKGGRAPNMGPRPPGGQQSPADYQGNPTPSGQDYRPQLGAGEFSCQGENCSSPAGPQLPRMEQAQQGELQPMRQFVPSEAGSPPPEGVSGGTQIQSAESAPPPPTDGGSSTDAATTGGTAPAEPVAPAPIQESAPAPTQESAPAQGTTGSISPNSMVGTAINALRSLFLLR